MTSRYALSVAVAPGTGLIARRDQTLLFLPEPDDRAKILLDAFSHGPVEDIWDRLAESVIDQEFDVCAFSCVTAAEQIEIRVFGSTHLDTDLRSAPMLSGSGSGTWVEHRVHGHPHSATITTGTDDVDQVTSLNDGIVHAGGFTAALVEQHRRPEQQQGRPTAIDIPRPDESELLSYVQGLTESDTEVEPDDVPADTTLEPEAVAELASNLPMVAARVCKSGHANAPSRTSCAICDVFLPAGDDGVTFAPRPSLGSLVFDDDQVVELTADVMVGRNPSRNGDNWIAVAIDGDRISRTHLTVRCSDWDVLLEDAGSHNGTVIVPSDGSQPVALVAGTPYLIEPGSKVYFGSSSFVFEGRSS